MEISESDIFRNAAKIWSQMNEAKEEMAKHSQTILRDRSELFDEVMVLQLSAIIMLSQYQKDLDIKVRYALMLASSVFDHLYYGWNANLHAYYRVSLNLLRIIHESTVFELAVSIDDTALRHWLKDRLRINEARKKVKELLTQTSGNVIAENWEKNQRKRWSEFNQLAHASWRGVSIPTAKVRTPSGSPLYSPAGRIFNPVLCYDLSYLYLKEATDAILMMRLAFFLDQSKEWFARQKSFLSRANVELLKGGTIDEDVLRYIKDNLSDDIDV